MRQFILSLWAFATLLASLFAGACSGGSELRESPIARQPKRDVNVLLITVDTLRADYLSCYGRKTVRTGYLDALAQRGVRFTQAIAQIPLTTPSHASILTGTYPQVHKIRDISGFVMDSKVPTLATAAQEAGFETGAIIGAAVLNRRYGLNRGFTTYLDDMKEEKAAGMLPGVVAELRGEFVTRHALSWLEKNLRRGNRTQPYKNFFLWVHYYDPHFPYDPPPSFRSRYSKDLYGGEVAYVDEQVGHLLKWLSEQGLQDRTLIVVLSDHGESLGEHGEYTHGVFLYDSTMHIPLIIAGPGVPGGKVVQEQVRSIDVMPTILDIIGLPAGSLVQGVSLVPAISRGERIQTTYCYMETLYPKTHLGWSELRAMRTDQWKLIVSPKPELYEMVNDRLENRNLIDRYPAETNQLQKKVWEIAGPPESLGKLETQPVDEQTRQELQSLGYASAGTPRELRIDMTGPDPKDRAHILGVLERAADLMNRDRFSQAVPLLHKVLREDPTNGLLYQHLGVCYQRLGQFKNAIQLCQQAIENKADTNQTHADLGNLYVRLGERQLAADAMETAASLDVTDLQNLNNLATLYLELGRLADTERVLRAILAQNSRHAAAHNLLGILEIQRGHDDLARAHFDKAIEHDPELAQAYMNLGILAEEAGKYPLAISYYKKFLEKAEPKDHRDIIPKVKKSLTLLQAKSQG